MTENLNRFISLFWFSNPSKLVWTILIKQGHIFQFYVFLN